MIRFDREQLPDQTQADRHEEGWTRALDKLTSFVAHWDRMPALKRL